MVSRRIEFMLILTHISFENLFALFIQKYNVFYRESDNIN